MIKHIAGVVKRIYTAEVEPSAYPTQATLLSSPQTDANWYVRTLGLGDEASLLCLYEDVFGRKRDAAQFRWKLLSRAAWPGHMVWVAVEHGSERIVGHYAGIPLELTIKGQVHPAIHSVEAMAHPEYRRQGILTALGSRAHEDWATAGYHLVIGLPNDKWGTRTSALGYVPLFPLDWLKFPLRLDRVARRHIRIKAARHVVEAPALLISRAWHRLHLAGRQDEKHIHRDALDFASPNNEAMQFWPLLSNYFPNAVLRSPEWLRWRYCDEPSGEFKVVLCSRGAHPTGFASYRLVSDGTRLTGYLADLVVAPQDRASAQSLLGAVLADLDVSGAGSVMAASPPGSSAYSRLRACGFRRLSAGFTFEIVPLSNSIDPYSLKDPSLWHLAAGDFDIV